jgi:leucyl aminopeptidase (aminopeptidase T)
MGWPIIYHHYIPASSSFIEMMRGARKIVEHCAGVKPGENVVISTDTNKMRIAEVLAAAAFSAGVVPTFVVIPASVQGHMAPRCLDPSSPAGSRMSSSSQPPGLRPTPMRIEAIKHGARGATLCEVTEDCLCVGGILGDLECDRVGRRLGTLLSKAEEVRIRTPSGTDIKGEVAGRPVQYETGLFASRVSSPRYPTAR